MTRPSARRSRRAARSRRWPVGGASVAQGVESPAAGGGPCRGDGGRRSSVMVLSIRLTADCHIDRLGRYPGNRAHSAITYILIVVSGSSWRYMMRLRPGLADAFTHRTWIQPSPYRRGEVGETRTHAAGTSGGAEGRCQRPAPEHAPGWRGTRDPGSAPNPQDPNRRRSPVAVDRPQLLRRRPRRTGLPRGLGPAPRHLDQVLRRNGHRHHAVTITMRLRSGFGARTLDKIDALGSCPGNTIERVGGGRAGTRYRCTRPARCSSIRARWADSGGRRIPWAREPNEVTSGPPMCPATASQICFAV